MSKKQILYGKVITLDDKDTIAEAIVEENGKIVFVGSHDEAQKYKDGNTLVLDFGNACIYPGFMDAHVHGQMAAWQLSGYINLAGGDTLEDYIRIMQNFVKANPGYKSYIGTNFLIQKLKRYPTAKDLDKISTTASVYMLTEDKHICCCNTKVMKDLGIDAALVKKLNTQSILVDEKGDPVGCFEDTASMKIVSSIELPVDITRKGYIAWQRLAFSNGLTAVCEAAVIEDGRINNLCSRFNELVKTGIWKLRTYGVYLLEPNEDNMEQQIDWVKKCKQKFDTEYFKLTGVKVFSDGVVEAHTAFLLDDYADRPGFKSRCVIKDYDRFVKTIELANKNDLLVHVHCIGDAAAKFVTSAMVDAQNNLKIKDARNCICHLELVSPEDIEKMGKNHIIACVAPLWVPSIDIYGNIEEEYVGKERKEQLFKIKSFIDAGAVTCFHSDYPGCHSVSPIQGIYRAITRCDAKRGKSSLRNASESITRKQALYGYTRNAAYSFREEKRLGSIEVGKIANFSVIDKDFLTCPVEDIPKAKVINTIVDGKIVY